MVFKINQPQDAKLSMKNGIVGIELDCGFFYPWIEKVGGGSKNDIFTVAKKAHKEKCDKCKGESDGL